MRTFYMHPFAAAVIFSVLLMGALGGLVVWPVVIINWLWNAILVKYTALPHIEIWQSCLLYLACASVVYLTGWVRIDIKAETTD